MADQLTEPGNALVAAQVTPPSYEKFATVPPDAIATKYDKVPIRPPATETQVVEVDNNPPATHDVPVIEYAVALLPVATAIKIPL